MTLAHDDDFLRQAVSAAHGIAGAYLGLWEQAFDLLSTQGQGPIPAATAEALLTAGVCARALGRSEAATALLNEAYAVVGVDDSVEQRSPGRSATRVRDSSDEPDQDRRAQRLLGSGHRTRRTRVFAAAGGRRGGGC